MQYQLPEKPYVMTDEEQECVLETIALFWQLHSFRAVFSSQWEEVSQLVLPDYRNTFFYGSFNWPGEKKTDRQRDATGMMALGRFGAICDSLLTPQNSMWHALSTSDPELRKSRRVRLWFEAVTNLLFRERYAPSANFIGQNQANFIQLGAFGTSAMFIDELDDPITHERGLRYKAVPLGELFLTQNHQGRIDGFIRWMRLTARQIYQKFGPERFPDNLRSPLEAGSEMPFDLLHRVCARTDYNPRRLDHKGKPWASYYIAMSSKVLLREGGYRSFPLSVGRYTQAPMETYGRSPAMAVLPSLKTLNMEKALFLRQGHRAAEPAYLTSDDGLVDGLELRPGAFNKGGVTAEGQPLVHILPTGQIQVTQEMMNEERELINDAFLVSLFQILTETPQMTATEVIERTNEKGILLAPTVGRQQAEYLGPMIERELDILNWQRKLPPMPPELIEAKGQFDIVYTSPLAKAMKAQEAAGFMRTVESAIPIVQATGDAAIFDAFDFDTAFAAIADIQAVPESWMASPQAIQQKAKMRAKAQQQQAQIQAMPAQAAMMKAQAVAAKTQNPNAPGTGQGALQVAPQGVPSFAQPET